MVSASEEIAIKIAHLPFCYYPDPVGGTEVYVRGLAREQQQGSEVFVVAPAETAAEYQHEGIKVYRYAVSSDFDDIAELYVSDKSVDTAGFVHILDVEKPDVLHVHGYTRAVTRAMLAAAHERGICIVFTYHTPTATCVRGSLMRFGHTECDGALLANRCAACVLQAKGVPKLVARTVVHLPTALSRGLKTGRLATGLRMRELVQRKHEEIRAFLHTVDHVIAPADWVMQLLLFLGVPRHKMTLNRQGTSLADSRPLAEHDCNVALRLAFVGRIDPPKGLHILFDALQRVPSANVELHVFGVAQNHDAYSARMRSAAARDRRIVWEKTIAADDMTRTLQTFDLLLVPSQWYETGPLVVLEAFAAGVPVVGSKLAGIAELVRDGVDGILLPFDDVHAWQHTIEKLARDRAEVAELRRHVRQPRTMQRVAQEMAAVYRALLEPA